MTRLIPSPPLPRSCSDVVGLAFLQRIELRDGRSLIGHCLWHLPPNEQGVVQLVELIVSPTHRRHGHASALLNEAVSQARALCKLKRIALRRMWCPLEQKSQVLARSFLTRHGFHHTATIADLLRDEDVLVYVRSFD